jgi:tetratricopeptide (TPR) repeat protein
MINEPVDPESHADWLAGHGRVDEAVAVLTEWFRTSGEIGALDRLCGLLEEHERAAEAEAHWRAAAATGLPGARRGLAYLLHDLGRLDEALAEWQAVVRDGDPDAREQVARLLGELDRPDQAIAVYQAMVAAGDAAAGTGLARMYARANRPEEALRAYRTAIAEGGELRWPLGALYERFGRLDEAVAAYRDALTAGEQRARMPLVRALARAGRLAEATDVIQDSGRGPYFQLGWLLAAQRRFTDLEAEAERIRQDTFALAHLITGAQRHANAHDDCPADCRARAEVVAEIPE